MSGGLKLGWRWCPKGHGKVHFHNREYYGIHNYMSYYKCRKCGVIFSIRELEDFWNDNQGG
jgi:hypothetical protein